MGHRSLVMLLRQAGLGQYVDAIPPRDETPSITVAQFSRLVADIHDTFGARAARPIFLHGGRAGAAQMRRLRPAQLALVSTTLRLQSPPRRMRRVLTILAEQGEELYGTPHLLAREGDTYFIQMPECPYCAEIARRRRVENRPALRPVCHIPLAAIAEMVEWAMGQKHLVEEVTCIAMGDPTCRFRIGP
jgi:hypothetical protein